MFKKYAEEYDITLVSGGCKKGADDFAKLYATTFNIEIKEHLPKVSGEYSKKDYAIACHARNKLIAEDCNILIALVKPERKGGTENTIKHAKKLKKPIILL